MLAELYVPAFRTLICVPRLRGPEGVVVVGSDKRRIQIIHKPNLFHTSRFCKLSGKLLNSDRERYFFMFMKDAGHMLKLNVAGRRRKSHPPSPNSKPRS